MSFKESMTLVKMHMISLKSKMERRVHSVQLESVESVRQVLSAVSEIKGEATKDMVGGDADFPTMIAIITIDTELLKYTLQCLGSLPNLVDIMDVDEINWDAPDQQAQSAIGDYVSDWGDREMVSSGFDPRKITELKRSRNVMACCKAYMGASMVLFKGICSDNLTPEKLGKLMSCTLPIIADNFTTKTFVVVNVALMKLFAVGAMKEREAELVAEARRMSAMHVETAQKARRSSNAAVSRVVAQGKQQVPAGAAGKYAEPPVVTKYVVCTLL